MKGAEATEEADAGEGTDPNLLLSTQTDFPSEVGLKYFNSEYRLGDLNPASRCGPQRYQLVAVGSGQPSTPTRDIYVHLCR